MLSSGGLTHVAEAERTPVQMLESGPAAGALAAAFFGARRQPAATCSPSTWAAPPPSSRLVDGGEPLTAYSFEAARQKRFIEGSGLPIRISTIELIEIGAGGGSHRPRRRDRPAQGRPAQRRLAARARRLRPRRPRADRDRRRLPARLPQPRLLRRRRDARSTCAAARAALERAGRAACGSSPIEVAWGIHDVVNENMAGAARVHIAERGRDPRDYALLCTGGAGPVHAYDVARKLGLRQVICPPAAGVASALGLLVAPARVDRVATVGIRLDRDSVAALEAAFRRLEDEARAVMADTGLTLETRHRAPARRRPLPRPGLRPGRRPARRPLRRLRRLRAAPDGRLRDGLPREVRAHAARRAGRVHQHPRRGARAGRGRARSCRRARRGRRARGGAVKGTRPPTSPRPAASWRRPCTTARAWRPATRSAAPRWSRRKARRWWSAPAARRRVAASGNIVVTLRVSAPSSTPSRSRCCGRASSRSSTRRPRPSCAPRSRRSPTRPTTSPACSPTRAATRWPRTAAASRPSSAPCPPPCATSCARWAPTRMRPGDVLITNDAWMGTGHMSDVSRAQADLPPRPAGGLLGHDLAHAGHRRAHPRHRGARGVRGGPAHPAHEARARRARRTTRWSQLIRANVRTPDQTMGDIWAQVSANELMERRVQRAHGRLRARRRSTSSATSCSRAPSGAMRDGHPRGARRHLPLRASRPTASTRRSTSSSRSPWPATRSSPTTPAPRPQQPRAINCVLAYTYAMTAYAVRCALLPGPAQQRGHVPADDGRRRPRALCSTRASRPRW